MSTRSLARLRIEALHHLKNDRVDEALEAVELAVRLPREGVDPAELSLVFEAAVRVHVERGDIDEAITAAREMLRLRVESGHEAITSAGRVMLSNLLVKVGELAEAEELLMTAAGESARYLGAEHAETRLIMNKLALLRKRRELAKVVQ